MDENKQNITWVKVEGDETPAWKPEKEGDAIEGVLVEKREKVGPNESNVYDIEEDEGKTTSVWGSAVIDSRMSKIPTGRMVKIVYKGLAQSRNGREYKDYEIFVGEPAVLRKDDDGVDKVNAELAGQPLDGENA